MKYKSLIEKMTLEEKVSFMSGKDFWTTGSLERLGIPSIFLSDGPHGIRKQKDSPDHAGLNESIPATCYPTASTVANSWNLELAEELGKYLGKEARSQNVNVLLGPGTNIKRNPLCGRNFEYFSEDPLLAGKLSAAYIRGIQSNGVSACLKHFAANNQEFRRMVVESVIDERALREIYLKPFEIGIKESNLKCLMSSYNRLNGDYTNENTHLMKDILRDEWNYQGVVVTDWGGSNDRVKGLLAGNSLEMPSTSGETNVQIVEAIKSGLISESVLDENLNQLLTLIFDTSEINSVDESFDIEEHHTFAEKVALESIVLLKNENNILPLDNNHKVVIIGDFAKKPRYQGAGSSIVNPTKIDDTISVIEQFDLKYIGYEVGFERYGKNNNRLTSKAVNLARQSDVILLYLGLDEYSEAEGIDRSHMSLPKNQLFLLDELLKLNKKIVVVLSCGSAIEMPWADQVDAILHTSLSGQAGAKATLKILTGIENPSGKLSETYAINYSDYPSSPYFPGKEETSEYRESIFVGYRYFDTNNSRVKYPFGYGLSYTKFFYSDLKIIEDKMSFRIKNIGNVLGKEVAQIYVRALDSKVFRPFKELKSFVKIELQPQESKTIDIELDDNAYKIYNNDSKSWIIEDLDYEILIGSSSSEIHLKATLHKSGIDLNPKLDKTLLPSYYNGNILNIESKEFEKLYGKDLPNPKTSFYKKNRLIVHYNTTISYLKYARGFTGRLLYLGIKLLIKYYKLTHNREKANFFVMGILHLPLRGLARMSGGIINHGQLDGLIMMFNGKFFKGYKKFRLERKIKKTK
ncbi:MAG: glycosyl hydrolase [Tenericutes bacterium HGW-Tenericutes-5]|jgi:beta-glucosidase|nr:MAG: glycosyl hydrolase [Tenericutes bacterium HGW-Tenericutes-5]